MPKMQKVVSKPQVSRSRKAQEPPMDECLRARADRVKALIEGLAQEGLYTVAVMAFQFGKDGAFEHTVWRIVEPQESAGDDVKQFSKMHLYAMEHLREYLARFDRGEL